MMEQSSCEFGDAAEDGYVSLSLSPNGMLLSGNSFFIFLFPFCSVTRSLPHAPLVRLYYHLLKPDQRCICYKKKSIERCV